MVCLRRRGVISDILGDQCVDLWRSGGVGCNRDRAKSGMRSTGRG